jgi:hypothetical protein
MRKERRERREEKVKPVQQDSFSPFVSRLSPLAFI